MASKASDPAFGPKVNSAAPRNLDPDAYEIPDHIRFSKLLKRRKLNKQQLAEFKEKMLLLYAPEAIQVAMNGLCAMAHKKDLGAIKLILEIFGYIERKGVNITQQVLNAQSQSTPGISFDAFVRSVHEARSGGRPLTEIDIAESRLLREPEQEVAEAE